MSQYTKTTAFTPKDSLPSGDPEKIILGADFDVEFDAIAVAITSKYDSSSRSTLGDAQAGTDNTTVMTPLRVKNAIDTFAGRLATANTFTGKQTIENTGPILELKESDQAADEITWQEVATGSNFLIRTRDDANTTGVDAIKIIRGTGTAVTQIEMTADDGLLVNDEIVKTGSLSMRITTDFTTTSIVPVAVSGLNNIPLEDGAWYAVRALLRFVCTDGAGAAFTFVFTQTPGEQYAMEIGSEGNLTNASDMTLPFTYSTGSVHVTVLLTGAIHATTPGGTLSLHAAMADVGGASHETVLKKGSWISLERLPS